ncbi:hypothetical protein ACKJV2_000977 [Campylobacter upsaliensis]
MIFFSNRDLGLTNSKLNTALRSKGTAWALARLKGKIWQRREPLGGWRL